MKDQNRRRGTFVNFRPCFSIKRVNAARRYYGCRYQCFNLRITERTHIMRQTSGFIKLILNDTKTSNFEADYTRWRDANEGVCKVRIAEL